jgi:hypothetical protein
MRMATSSATSGGAFSSSEPIATKVRHNAKAQRAATGAEGGC